MMRRRASFGQSGTRLLVAILLSSLSLQLLAASTPQPSTPQDQAAQLLKTLSPQERVGQLFLVTFQGGSVDSSTPIYELITRYHVGGVLLTRANGNLKEGAGEAASLTQLTAGLQQAEAEGQGVPIQLDEKGNTQVPSFIPLLIALQQQGNGYPGSALLSDVSALPSPMAIGATWNTDLAQAAGEVVGRDLAALGVNLLIGPSLDVLERPNASAAGDLGVQVFGGDPFWVGMMGSAYIRGVHEGSEKKVAVVATHFPGIGGSDRDPEDEIATVRKALDELKQIDLAPFAAVAQAPPGEAGTTDGMLVSHIRYQGLQGNIRASTRPVSLDEQALGQLMGLSEFATWRAGGGLTVSDSLGARSVRRFYDPTATVFTGHLVAKDAFLAGNDLLLLEDFRSSGVGDERVSIEETIDSFVQKYREDSAFAKRVDESALRILTLKLRLYPLFDSLPSSVSPTGAGELAADAEVPFEIEKAALTLLSPGAADTSERPLEPPGRNDRVVFITDSRTYRACPSCETAPLLAPDAIRKVVERLYGPTGSAQVTPAQLRSYTYADLAALLQGNPSADLQADLGNSTVIVVLALNSDPTVPASHALSDLLAQRADLVRQRRVVVFAMDAPYYLDSTEMSKLTAYYALYSKVPAAVEVAARTLFGELSPHGASPVSIDSAGYSLAFATSPDPSQIIPLVVVGPGGGAGTPSPTPRGYRIADSLTLQAGPVLDHNRNEVPDGTVVRFQFTYPAENMPPLVLEATTRDGVAQVSHVLDRMGALEVRAESDPALLSTIIKLQVSQLPGFVTAVAPAPAATETPVMPPAVPSPSATPEIVAPPKNGAPTARPLGSLGVALLGLATFIAGSLAFYGRRRGPRRLAPLRLSLVMSVGGLAVLDYLTLDLPGSGALGGLGPWGMVLGTLLGAGVALGIVLVVRSSRKGGV